MIKLFIFSLFFITLTVFANEVCQIKTYAQIYHIGKIEQIGLQDFIIESSCPAEVQKKFQEIAFSFKGNLYSEYLIKNFSEDLSNFDVELMPNKIEIQSTQELLKKQITLPTNWEWGDIKILNQSKLLLLNNHEKIVVKCGNCQTSGSKNIEAIINNSITGVSRKEWINATIVIKTQALVAKRSLTANNLPLTLSDFEIQTIESVRPERFFTDRENLHFYKLNKAISQGTPLENTDLTPLNLVTQNNQVQVIIQSDFMVLRGTALALRSGKMGETIQLKNASSQKTILGKIIDFNKVLIEL